MLFSQRFFLFGQAKVTGKKQIARENLFIEVKQSHFLVKTLRRFDEMSACSFTNEVFKLPFFANSRFHRCLIGFSFRPNLIYSLTKFRDLIVR